MTATLAADHARAATELQFATFYVGHMLLGIDIRVVQEISRHAQLTQVPHAPEYVRGVINLRGDVATVIDLRTILGLPKVEADKQSRNLIVHHDGEAIGLLVDKISDILTIRESDILPPPANVNGVDGSVMRGVCTLDSGVVVLLDLERLLAEGEH
jgi:purine-binding chemotaxis protein CheW